jgi:hypothetical protein
VHAGSIQKRQGLRGGEELPIRLAIVDMGIEDGQRLGMAGGNTAAQHDDEEE